MKVVKTIQSLLKAIEQLRSSDDDEPLVFRGETSDARKLLPKSARPEYQGPDWQLSFDAWERKARELKKLPANEWRRLALAQHHGLATPLLDWSSNPLVAAYFCAGSGTEPERDGTVFCFKPAFRWDPMQNKGGLAGLKAVLGLTRKRMPYGVLDIERFSPRQVAQQALFTVHYNETVCMKEEDWPFMHKMDDGKNRTENLTVLKVPHGSKVRIRRELADLGVTPSTMFPDLDGASEEINRLLRSRARNA
tara:strand:+ start:5857 stop:6606 length:750 start_codon:yes stop_codon:yes gene_type:complete